MKRFLLVLFLLLILAIPIQAQETIYLPIITKGDSCMGIAKLAISDGTTEISLLDLQGIHLAEDDGWTPKIIQAKSGGVFQDSSMAAGRRLVYRQFGTAREDFTFNIMGISQDELIAQTSDLLMMLEKAVNYWATDWQSDIVYLIAQSDCETYARYAPILYYEAQELQNPYGQPFVQAGDGAIFDDIGIMIERGHWQDVAPGDSECVEIESIENWANEAKWTETTAVVVGFAQSFLQSSTGRIFAGDTGQILYSDDDGDNWAVSTLLPTATVYSLLQTTTGRILAGDNGTIWYTDNDGVAWAALTVLPVSDVTSLLQTTTGRILAGENGQIWYSDDNGASWAVLTTLPSNVVFSLLQTTTGRILAGDSHRILYSDDNGASWGVLPLSLLDFANSLIQTSSGRIIAGVGDGGVGGSSSIYYSDNDGNTWSSAYETFSAVQVTSVYQISTGRIFATVPSNIYYSDNDGNTWVLSLNSPASGTFVSLFQTSTGKVLSGALHVIWQYIIDTIELGASDSNCDSNVFVSNKQNIANLTDIYIDDGGVWSSNLIPMTAFPVTLLPAVPAVNDAIYFGIDTSVDNSGPFSNLVFDLSTIITYTNSYTITWEYWSGAAWSALTVKDGTSSGGGSFSTFGVNSIHWSQPSNWATRDISVDGGPAITGYWVRARVSAIVGSITAPDQQNISIYSTVNGFTDIDYLSVTGDISALSQEKLTNRSDEDGPGGSGPNLYDNRMIIGLRLYDRGNNFQSYINISDEQNPFGISISVGTNTTIGTDIAAPSGRSATYNPGGVEAMATRATVTLLTTIARDFYGSYHAFLRVQRTAGASTDFDVQLVFVTGSGGIQKTTESKQVQTTTAFELLDFGQITIPVGGSLSSSDLGDQIQILIQASAASGTPNLVLYDLILIPVDEWAIDSVDQTNSSISDIGRSSDISKLLDIDSVTDPKNPIKSIVRQVGSDFVTANYNPITNGPAILQSNVDQRLWFLAAQTSATGSSYSWIAPPEICHSVQLYKAQRYLGLRGNR